MAAAAQAERDAAAQTGAYLTDGVRLFYVVAAHEGMVALEDCARPEEPAKWLGVRLLLSRRLRRVSRGRG